MGLCEMIEMHIVPSSSWRPHLAAHGYQALEADKLNFYLILINLSLNHHMWLVAMVRQPGFLSVYGHFSQ